MNRLQDCKVAYSEESIHDFRVSIRRFNSALSLVNDVFPSKYVVSLLKILKKQLKAFNDLRDTQVQLIRLKDLIYQYPVLYTFYNYLRHFEFFLIQSLKEEIQRFSTDDIEGAIFFLKLDLKREASKNIITKADALQIGINAFYNVLDKVSIADISNLDTIHKIRISFKKFRYVMEILKPITEWNKQKFQLMKEFQNILGSIQDNKVFFYNLEEYIADQTEIPKSEFKTILVYILKERDQLLNTLTEKYSLLDSLKIDL